MLAVVGTLPTQSFPLLEAPVTLNGNRILAGGYEASVNRGTAALLAAAIKTGQVLGLPKPVGYLVGDIGLGDGSRRLYEFLTEHLERTGFRTIAFHYVLPNVTWQNPMLQCIDRMAHRPVLIADAGSMYVAKMSGHAGAYDLFTPDAGELAFLADEKAPHPFYTRGFILHEENLVPDLVARTYAHGNGARHLLVKGVKDYLANREGIQAIIDDFPQQAMEAIGGTGDTLTGIAAALSASGMDIHDAASLAARVNRLAGHTASPTPATQVVEIIRHIPRALQELLEERETRP